jgi:hypothetical protein
MGANGDIYTVLQCSYVLYVQISQLNSYVMFGLSYTFSAQYFKILYYRFTSALHNG